MKAKTITISMLSLLAASVATNASASDDTATIAKYVPKACLILVDGGEQYCQQKGETPLAQLPEKFYQQPIYVQAEPGVEVILSDVDNLADKTRKVYLAGTVMNDELTNIESSKGQYIDVSRPSSMKVVSSDTKLGCIRNISTDQMYCIPKGKKVKVLPDYVYDQPVELRPMQDTRIKASIDENLPAESSIIFDQTTLNDQLENVITKDNVELNFQKIKSMAVLYTSTPKACITSRQTGAQFCLTAGKNTGLPEDTIQRPYALPSWILNHEIDLKVDRLVTGNLSNRYNLADNEFAYFAPGDYSNKKLEKQETRAGDIEDLSSPVSMSVFSCKNYPSRCE